MPRECPPVFRSAPAVAGTGSAKRRSVRPPSAIAPVRCRAQCCASPETGWCDCHADLAGWTPRHSHGRPIRSQDDGAVVPALPASLGWLQPVRGLAAKRYDWLRSVEWREEPRDRRRLDGVCCQAWPARWDSVSSARPKNCPDRTAVYNCLGPINLSVACQPVSQREVDQFPDARLLPIT